MVTLHFGKKKEVPKQNEVPLPTPELSVENKEEPQKVQVFSWYELQSLQILNAILEEQIKIRKIIEEASKD